MCEEKEKKRVKRRFLIAILAVGAVLGYGMGFRSMCHAHERRAAFERHVAQVCVEAAGEAAERNSEAAGQAAERKSEAAAGHGDRKRADFEER